jgi:hypothetical protein
MEARPPWEDFQVPFTAFPEDFSTSAGLDFGTDPERAAKVFSGTSCALTAKLIIPTANAAAIVTFIMY